MSGSAAIDPKTDELLKHVASELTAIGEGLREVQRDMGFGPKPSDPFEAEVAKLLTEEKNSAEFDRLMAKTQFFEPFELLCLWMVATGAMPENMAPLVRLQKVALMQFCARRDLLKDFGEAMLMYQDDEEATGALLERLGGPAE